VRRAPELGPIRGDQGVLSVLLMRPLAVLPRDRRVMYSRLPSSGSRIAGSSLSCLLTDKRCIPLRSPSVRTPHLFTTGFPRFLPIRGARGLQAFNLLLRTIYSNPNYYYTRKQLSYTRER
jgi:hypothetical protein